MNDYSKENRGSIWGNKRKTKDTHPDFTGTMNVEGREYFVDGWKRKPDANPNAPSMTFKVKPKDAAAEGHPDRFQQPMSERARPTGPRGGAMPDLGDDVPFAPFR